MNPRWFVAALLCCSCARSADTGLTEKEAYDVGCSVGSADGALDGHKDGKACAAPTYGAEQLTKVVDYCPGPNDNGPCVNGWTDGYYDCYSAAYDLNYEAAKKEGSCD